MGYNSVRRQKDAVKKARDAIKHKVALEEPVMSAELGMLTGNLIAEYERLRSLQRDATPTFIRSIATVLVVLIVSLCAVGVVAPESCSRGDASTKLHRLVNDAEMESPGRHRRETDACMMLTPIKAEVARLERLCAEPEED